MKVQAETYKRTHNHWGITERYTRFNIVEYCCDELKEYLQRFESVDSCTEKGKRDTIIKSNLLCFIEKGKFVSKVTVQIRYCPFCGEKVKIEKK